MASIGEILAQALLDDFAERLEEAVCDINTGMRMTVWDQVAPLDDQEVSQMENPFEKPKMTTIGEQLKAARAQLAEARHGAANAVAESADSARIVKSEVEKVLKEAADLRAEVAELTNGGPALNE